MPRPCCVTSFAACSLAIPVLLGVATLVFALIHLVPGDPARSDARRVGRAGRPRRPARRSSDSISRSLAQYERFMAGLATGDLGTSFRYGTPVAAEIGQRLGRTCELALAAMLVAIAIAMPLGVVGALYRGRADRSRGDDGLACGNCDAEFLAGPAPGARRSAVKLGWLPVSGTGIVAQSRAAGAHARRARSRRSRRA